MITIQTYKTSDADKGFMSLLSDTYCCYSWKAKMHCICSPKTGNIFFFFKRYKFKIIATKTQKFR